MSTAFMNSSQYFLTSESVTEGHPDKLCDQISDAVVDNILSQDPEARIACETCTTNGLVIVLGEITTNAYVDVPTIARGILKRAGYTNAERGIDYKSCGVMVSIQEQSRDIDQAVSNALEARNDGSPDVNGPNFDLIGAGDQGMMVGFACNETPEMMPLPHSLSHRLCQRLAMVRKEGMLPYLWPDGKSQVTVEYSYGVPKRIDTIVVSAQHSPDVEQDSLERDIKELVVKSVVPAGLMDEDTKIFINPSGRFVTGGAFRRYRSYGKKNSGRHLRRAGASRRGGFFRQGSDQGGPLRRLRGPIRCQERCCCRPRRQGRGPGFLRHWSGEAYFCKRRDLWHRQGARRPYT